VKNWTYNREVETLLEQFTSAFNDIVIKREDPSGNFPGNGFKVNFVYAPKTRVFDVLKNPAPGGLTLPAVAININSIQRDPTRNFNKNWGFNIETVNPSLTGTDSSAGEAAAAAAGGVLFCLRRSPTIIVLFFPKLLLTPCQTELSSFNHLLPRKVSFKSFFNVVKQSLGLSYAKQTITR
jgi:hypothetical protein